MSINNIRGVKKEKCALIIIDMQNDFIAEGAPIECPGGREIISSIKKLKAWGKVNKMPIFYTQEIHRKQKVDFGLELVRNEPEHCLEGTEGVEIVAELTPEDDEFVIKKRRYSGYYLTDLELLMNAFDRNVLIIVGAATNVCVYATALDAVQRNVQPIVVSDGVAGTSVELHEAFLKNIDYVIGDVVTAEDLIKSIN
ncbi:isochorismatase [Synergistales bacterium]|nr:isochorismatase [Synergistales bacterium]